MSITAEQATDLVEDLLQAAWDYYVTYPDNKYYRQALSEQKEYLIKALATGEIPVTPTDKSST